VTDLNRAKNHYGNSSRNSALYMAKHGAQYLVLTLILGLPRIGMLFDPLYYISEEPDTVSIIDKVLHIYLQ
jgi:hypothetical protein